MSFWTAFGIGCMGAIAPEILRLYKIRNRKIRIRCPAQYFLLSILFVSVGGALAIVFEARSPQSAFFIGLSTPTVLSTIACQRVNSAGVSEPQGVERGGNRNVRETGSLHAYTWRQYLYILFC